LAVDAAGNAYLAWSRFDSTASNIEGSSRPPGGSFSTPVVLKSVDHSTGRQEQNPQVAADGAGNGVAIWTDFNQANESVDAAGFDGAGPQLRNLSVPATGAAGQAVTDSVSPVDVWSSVPSTAWNFGDGSTGSGTSVSHAYGAAGTYNVSVTSTDAVGNASTATRSVTVSPASQPPPPPRPRRQSPP
jgi:hypothetical protein